MISIDLYHIGDPSMALNFYQFASELSTSKTYIKSLNLIIKKIRRPKPRYTTLNVWHVADKTNSLASGPNEYIYPWAIPIREFGKYNGNVIKNVLINNSTFT